MAGQLIGAIVAYAVAADNVPPFWLPCDGSIIPPQYTDLIAALGSNNTPDLRGRTLIGSGSPPNVNSTGSNPNFSPGIAFPLSQTGGEYAHLLSGSEVPSHTHVLNNGQDSEEGSGHEFPLPPQSTNEPTYDDPQTNLPHNTMQPYYVVNYFIYAGSTEQ